MKRALLLAVFGVELIALAVIITLAVSAKAQSLFVGPAPPFRLADVCPGFTLSTNRGLSEVYVRCPPQKEPWITIKQCAQPVVERHPNGVDVSIHCTKPVKA